MIIKNKKYDVVHAHGLKMNTMLRMAAIFLPQDIKLFNTLHLIYSRQNIISLKDKLRIPYLRVINKLTNNRIRRTTVVSEAVRNNVRGIGYIPEDIKVIYNGTDIPDKVRLTDNQKTYKDSPINYTIGFAGRLKEENAPLPDLIVIDGGKGQLASAYDALVRLGLRLPVISLAKREESVFVPGRQEPIPLPKKSKGLTLLIQIRDEAHRFAITYHKLLR